MGRERHSQPWEEQAVNLRTAGISGQRLTAMIATIRAELLFAKTFGIDPAPIVMASANATLSLRDVRVQVRAIPHDSGRILSVAAENIKQADVYVLAEYFRAQDDPRAISLLGWCWWNELSQAPQDLPGYVPIYRMEAMNLHAMTALIPQLESRAQEEGAMLLIEHRNLPNGLVAQVKWWTDRKSAVVTVGNQMDVIYHFIGKHGRDYWSSLDEPDLHFRSWQDCRDAIIKRFSATDESVDDHNDSAEPTGRVLQAEIEILAHLQRTVDRLTS